MDPDWGIDGVRIGKSMETTIRGPFRVYTTLEFLGLRNDFDKTSLDAKQLRQNLIWSWLKEVSLESTEVQFDYLSYKQINEQTKSFIVWPIVNGI